MQRLKYYTIYLDGMDKTGKDTIAKYVIILSKYRYVINCRGIITQVAYDKLYNRNCVYDIEQQKDVINVLLTVDEDDWNIRCKITNEPKIDYNTNSKSFEDAYNELVSNGMVIPRFNTSTMSPYEIAKQIVEYADKLNSEVK